jgi:hypothetical protein
MNGKREGTIEVSSQQLLDELIEIKDRVGALENVASLANQEVLIKFFKEALSTDIRKKIMRCCEEPKTREQLMTECGFNSKQALHNHLKFLREGLVHEAHIEGVAHFEWSLLFKRVPKSKRDALIK